MIPMTELQAAAEAINGRQAAAKDFDCVAIAIDELRRWRETAATDRPEIVCLCGSSRFVDVMAVLAWELEKDGYIVLSLHLLPYWYAGVAADHQAEVEGVAAAMDELHLRKIDLADKVFVVNKDGYIGESTAREIGYATAHGKPVRYLEPPGAVRGSDGVYRYPDGSPRDMVGADDA